MTLVLLQWALVAVAAGVAQYAQAWPVTVAVVVLIGTRQHALLVLMHEAAHGLLCRNRLLNDMFSALLVSFPLLMSTSQYRAHHFAHHLQLNTARDPDIADARLPLSRAFLARQLLADVSGLSTLKSLRSIGSFGATTIWRAGLAGVGVERLLFVIFVGAVLASVALTRSGHLLLLYWVGPLCLVLPLLLRLRSLGEHAGLVDAPRGMDARSIVPAWWERLSVAPCHINRHWEHHLFPKVPCYRLERLARAIRGALPSGAVHDTFGYVLGSASVLSELFSPHGAMR